MEGKEVPDRLVEFNEPDAPEDPGWRRRRREYDVKHTFKRFCAELDDRAAIRAAAQHVDVHPAWRVREEWAREDAYRIFLAFWVNYRRESGKTWRNEASI